MDGAVISLLALTGFYQVTWAGLVRHMLGMWLFLSCQTAEIEKQWYCIASVKMLCKRGMAW